MHLLSRLEDVGKVFMILDLVSRRLPSSSHEPFFLVEHFDFPLLYSAKLFGSNFGSYRQVSRGLLRRKIAFNIEHRVEVSSSVGRPMLHLRVVPPKSNVAELSRIYIQHARLTSSRIVSGRAKWDFPPEDSPTYKSDNN